MTKLRQILECRQVADSAASRCIAYAACSELVASPHEVDPRSALLERAGVGIDLAYAATLETLLAEAGNASLECLRDEYSGLFEVGSDGPPAPIREQLARGDRGGIREEIVRYYEHFNYPLAEPFAWQPDHLSIELEFMHYVCFHEFQAPTATLALPFQLAQVDFAERHLITWLPQLATRVDALAPDSLYARIATSVAQFVAADHAWQQTTLGQTN